MKLVFEKTFKRTIDEVVESLSRAPEGTRAELWVFENAPIRRAAEERLAASGVRARVRSAYKPLLHHFLEDVDAKGLSEVRVTYPVHTDCVPNRFLLETYPLAALLPGVEPVFEPVETDAFEYGVFLGYADGRREERSVFAPNRTFIDFVGDTVVTSTGWLKVSYPDGRVTAERLETDYEAMYAAALDVVATHDWGETEPFFDCLNLRVALPAEDVRLPVGVEAISLREAMHEDLYFSLLEVFQKKTERPISDRTICPGQIVPDIVAGDVPSLRIETRGLSASDFGGTFQDLASAERPLAAAQVASELEKIAGEAFSARSVAGREVSAVYRMGSDRAVMISGGQHANETTGVVGALRAAQALARRPEAHFSVAPLENPDGYDLHRRLCETNPHHMHHAARYTALGCDLEYQETEPLYEKRIREEAFRRTGAKLHINLHGYASHEWTRPLSGYIPRGFPDWMLPRGFFLVLRYHDGWEDRAARFMDRLTLRVRSVPGLAEFNEAQLKVYYKHVAEPGFRLVNGFPCQLSLDERTEIPLRLITEYPDETIGGKDFIAGHTAQAETALAAYDIFQALCVEEPATENGKDTDK